MRITIFTAGSQGDVQPCVMLGKGLKQAGYDVLIVAPRNFSAFIQSHGLAVYPLRGDVQEIMSSETGRKFMESGSKNPFQSILVMRKLLGPVAQQMAEDALEASRGAHALISLAVFAPLARTVADILGIRLIHVEPTPLLPTRHFPAAGWPIQNDLGDWVNTFSGATMLHVIWQWYRPFVNAFRDCHHLPHLRAKDFHHILRTTPLLGAYSPQIIPPPSDWPSSTHITGYWFQDTPPAWTPPESLLDFLAQGEAPVYAGFGSMSGRDPEALAEIVLAALEMTGKRGLIVTGWGGLQAKGFSKNVYCLDSAPHHWLFPRMAALVHHGGAGTTAEGLRAGVPALVVPFIVDQPFWGRRITALGVGAPPIPAKKLTASNLARAIDLITTDEAMRACAARIGCAIRQEDGVGNAVALIDRILGEPA